MASAELAQMVRRYAAAQLAEGCELVFSGDLAEDLHADPRAVARALREYGVTPGNLGAGLGRGYRAQAIVEGVPAVAVPATTAGAALVERFTQALGYDATGALQQAGFIA